MAGLWDLPLRKDLTQGAHRVGLQAPGVVFSDWKCAIYGIKRVQRVFDSMEYRTALYTCRSAAVAHPYFTQAMRGKASCVMLQEIRTQCTRNQIQS